MPQIVNYEDICNKVFPLLEEFEGFVASPYFCPADKLTIGYGNLIKSDIMYGGKIGSDIISYANTLNGQSIESKNDKLEKKYKKLISPEEARDLATNTCRKIIDEVNDVITVKLNTNEFAALTSFVFNLGIGKLRSSTLKVRINTRNLNNSKNIKEIKQEFPKWVYAGGRVLNGLVKRRDAECDLFFEPC